MEVLIKELINILIKELEVCQTLLSILELEKHHMSVMDIEALYETNKAKETQVAGLRMLEESREAVLRKFARVFSAGNIKRVSDIIPKIDEPHRTQLSTLKKSLDDIIQLIGKRNMENGDLCQFSISWIRNLLIQVGSASNICNVTYSKAGSIRQPENFHRTIRHSV